MGTIVLPLRPGESMLTYAIRLSDKQVSRIQTNAIMQLYYHLPPTKTKSIDILVDLVKHVAEKPDSFWSDQSRSLRDVVIALYGEPVFYGAEVFNER